MKTLYDLCAILKGKSDTCTCKNDIMWNLIITPYWVLILLDWNDLLEVKHVKFANFGQKQLISAELIFIDSCTQLQYLFWV